MVDVDVDHVARILAVNAYTGFNFYFLRPYVAWPGGVIVSSYVAGVATNAKVAGSIPGHSAFRQQPLQACASVTQECNLVPVKGQ